MIFKMLGFGQVTDLEAWTLLLAATALSLIVGWVLDMIAEQLGFGIFGNAALCMLALSVSLLAFQHYVGELSLQRLPLIMAFATASVTIHMFGLIFLRRALRL